jgi:thioredoxin reductase
VPLVVSKRKSPSASCARCVTSSSKQTSCWNGLYPEKYIYDIPGFPAIKAGELIANLEKQMQPFQHDVCLEEEDFR